MEQLSRYPIADHHPDVAPRRDLKLYRSSAKCQHCGSYRFEPYATPVVAPIGFYGRLSLRERRGRWSHRGRIDSRDRFDIAPVGLEGRYWAIKSAREIQIRERTRAAE